MIIILGSAQPFFQTHRTLHASSSFPKCPLFRNFKTNIWSCIKERSLVFNTPKCVSGRGLWIRDPAPAGGAHSVPPDPWSASKRYRSPYPTHSAPWCSRLRRSPFGASIWWVGALSQIFLTRTAPGRKLFTALVLVTVQMFQQLSLVSSYVVSTSLLV